MHGLRDTGGPVTLDRRRRLLRTAAGCCGLYCLGAAACGWWNQATITGVTAIMLWRIRRGLPYSALWQLRWEMYSGAWRDRISRQRCRYERIMTNAKSLPEATDQEDQ